MSDEHYEHFVQASAGGREAKLTIRAEGTAACELVKWQMADRTQYSLQGRYEARTEAYGWLRIERVTLAAPSAAITVPIEALGCELIYEVVKVARSPVVEHPNDMLGMSGRWNEWFDLLMFPIGLVVECYYGLKYLIEVDDLEAYPPDLRQHITPEFMRHLEDLVLLMDKLKFARVAGGS
jgi:hypothetical protein